jgi:hypothetical protein
MTNLSRRNTKTTIYYRLDIDDLDLNAMPEHWRKIIKSMNIWNISMDKVLFTDNALETRMADVYWEQETGFGCVKWQNWDPPKEIL